MWFWSSCLYSAVSLTRVREWRFMRKSFIIIITIIIIIIIITIIINSDHVVEIVMQTQFYIFIPCSATVVDNKQTSFLIGQHVT